MQQAAVINAFEQSRSLVPMNLDRGADYLR